MKLIGLTGGIGSGKSTIAAIFSTLSIPVYESDLHARHLINADPTIRNSIIQLLGPDAYLPNGEANRNWIASQVFSIPLLLGKLNEIIHPAVARHVKQWLTQPPQSLAGYAIKESAILFEENLTADLHATILVVAPEQVRIERVIKRDNTTEDKVRERIKNQWSDPDKIARADFVIYNDGQRSLIQQVTDIHQMILTLPA